jgi:hypothetical protein
MVNLISSEPKTGCYLLLILSNLQALKRRSSGVRVVAGVQELPSRRWPDRRIPPAGARFCLQSCDLPQLELLELLELLICIFPLNAAC